MSIEWTFENLGDGLNNLNPQVRKKVLEIANRLIEEEVIKKGVKEAQEWFLDKQG